MSLAYVLSLMLALAVLVPAVMILGVTPEIKEYVVGSSPTASYMNATSWSVYSNVYASFGLLPLLLICFMAVVLLYFGVFLAYSAAER